MSERIRNLWAAHMAAQSSLQAFDAAVAYSDRTRVALVLQEYTERDGWKARWYSDGANAALGRALAPRLERIVAEARVLLLEEERAALAAAQAASAAVVSEVVR